MLSSKKSYLIRAIHQWCEDFGHTPYLAVHVDEHCQVPQRFVSNGQIILNISNIATKDLEIENDYIAFRARFSGQEELIWVHVGAVLGIFPKDQSEEGIFFELQPYKPSEDHSDTPKKPTFKFVE